MLTAQIYITINHQKPELNDTQWQGSSTNPVRCECINKQNWIIVRLSSRATEKQQA